MCTCNAFTYASCRYSHSKFEPVSVCFLARIGLRQKCQERIVNGHPDIVRAWPVISGTCDVCFPEKAKAEEEERKRALKEEEKSRKEAERKRREEAAREDPTFCLGRGYWT
ncbi:hypothetical protein F5X98DRAFT_378176 [Xylaria grammica]|nr:hypothetical protein F5X98DRAFT_378176 [Xylaria grammica]